MNTKRKILVVDDEESIRRALGRTLKKEGYELILADGPEEALHILKGTTVDMVISDHLMPTMTGLEFLKVVRDRFPDTIRIMLTAHADMQTAVDAINQGEIYRLLSKPWDDTELKVMLFIAFQKLDQDRDDRRVLALARSQLKQVVSLESEHPGISRLVRDEDGAILIDARGASA